MRASNRLQRSVKGLSSHRASCTAKHGSHAWLPIAHLQLCGHKGQQRSGGKSSTKSKHVLSCGKLLNSCTLRSLSQLWLITQPLVRRGSCAICFIALPFLTNRQWAAFRAQGQDFVSGLCVRARSRIRVMAGLRARALAAASSTMLHASRVLSSPGKMP
jgi:hypothetical protein